jgi:hypothetical protein
MHRSRLTCTLLILVTSMAAFAQNQHSTRTGVSYLQRQPVYSYPGMRLLNDGLGTANFGRYPAYAPFANGQSIDTLAEIARRADAEAESRQSAYDDYMERQRNAAARERSMRIDGMEAQAHADPDAPDQSELLRNSKDRDFILRNFRTMYVDARDARYFASDQMKAALGSNKDFARLNVRIVDDPRVADVVLKVSYTFAWDYPFELRHQNTTYVLLSGKGEGPFSGPLGAADVARQFVNVTKPWRDEKGKPNQ